MKSDKLHKIAFLGLFTLLAAVPVLQSCDDDEKQKAVDLRYRVEDSYLLPADGTTDELSVTFQVKTKVTGMPFHQPRVITRKRHTM